MDLQGELNLREEHEFWVWRNQCTAVPTSPGALRIPRCSPRGSAGWSPSLKRLTYLSRPLPSDLAELPQMVVNGAEPRHSYCDLLLCRSSYAREGEWVIVCGAGRRQLSNLTRELVRYLWPLSSWVARQSWDSEFSLRK